MTTKVTQQNTGQETPRAIAEAIAYSTGWGDVASFLTAHPEIAKRARTAHPDHVLCGVNRIDAPAALMADAAQACVDAGGRVDAYQGEKFGGVHLWFGPVYIEVYADIDRVFARRVTGMVEQVEYTLTFDLPEQAEAVSA